MNTLFLSRFSEELGRPLLQGISLAEWSSFRIGGPADYFFDAPDLEGLVKALNLARSVGMRCTVIGGGYNILFDDKGFRGLIIHNSAQGISRTEEGGISALSGTSLEDLLDYCIRENLMGLEFMAGIPGTIGGAVYGNAGAFRCCIGDFLVRAEVLAKDGGCREIPCGDMKFSYRHSRLKETGELLLKAEFRPEPGKGCRVKERIEENLRQRKSRHPSRETACAGSYFKNPDMGNGEIKAAAVFLDQIGAKGMHRGGAVVSERHANFIINEGGAKAEDVLALADELKQRVMERFGVRLEEEVIFLPAVS